MQPLKLLIFMELMLCLSIVGHAAPLSADVPVRGCGGQCRLLGDFGLPALIAFNDAHQIIQRFRKRARCNRIEQHAGEPVAGE